MHFDILEAIAQELYPLGAQLIICARNKEELTKLKNELMKVIYLHLYLISNNTS